MRTITDHVVEGDAANHQVIVTVLDGPGSGGANHEYGILWNCIPEREPMGSFPIEFIQNSLRVKFQNGPIKEVGVNGVTDQSLVALVIDRYRGFQRGQYACDDNAEALAHLEAFMECSARRTKARIARGVEGTHEK